MNFSSIGGRVCLACLGLILAAGVSAGAEANRDEVRRLAARELVLLSVENPHGSLELIGEDREEIIVEAHYRVQCRNGKRAKEIAEDLSIEVREEDGRLTLMLLIDGERLDRQGHETLDDVTLGMDLMLRLPAQLALEAGVTDHELIVSGLQGDTRLRATSGKVELKELGGRVELTLTSGPLRCRNIAGPLIVLATSGDLDVRGVKGGTDLVSWTGQIRAEKINGKLNVESDSGNLILKEIDGALHVISASGDIDIQDPRGDVRVNSAGGDISVLGLGPARDGDGHLRLISSSGEVVLGILPGAGYHLDLSTDMGAMRVKLPLKVEGVSRRRLQGILGNGKGELQIVTATGDIRIFLTDE